MNKIYKAAIVGGGAAGLLCAVELLSGERAFRGDEIVILERNDRVGKKLIATGNGQGNVSNTFITAENYSGDPAFISSFISQLKTINLIGYFNRLGIITESDADGKIYPVSKQANSILDIIRAYLRYKGCSVITGCKIVSIKKEKTFILQAENGTAFNAEKVVFAAGGKAAKQFGTDGQAYSVLTALGHKITALYPSLVQLKTEKSAIKGLKGIKERVKLTLFDGKKPIKESVGDLLFTDYGVSGSAVFQISDKATGADDLVLEVEFAPELPKDVVLSELENRIKNGYIPFDEILNGIVHKKLGETIVANCGGKTNAIAEMLKRYRINVVGTLGFDYAQVTKGGVKTEDINEKTYESKLCSGLYVVGEILDVDGECGGYNLTFAFISGIVAAKAIKNDLKSI